MESVKTFVFGPTPDQRMRKCNELLRSNTRQLDRDMGRLKETEFKTRKMIVNASKRGQRNPSQAKSAAVETRTFARELVRIRRQQQRLATSKAQLASVQMQVKEAASMIKIDKTYKDTTGIMKNVNQAVKMPELMGTMRELSNELMKAGVVQEMVDDMLPQMDEDEFEDEEVDGEVNKILGEVLKDRTSKVPDVPADRFKESADEEEEDAEASLEQMRGRLEALRN